MFFNAVTFKDSATPFAEALVELHHEIMFYLVVIVSVVIFILVNAINITRVRESYFYGNTFSTLAFFKSIFLNSIFYPLFKKFLYSSYYSRLYFSITEFFSSTFYVIASNGSSYLNYAFRAILLSKTVFLSFLSLFSLLESFIARLFGDYKNLTSKYLLPNSIISNSFFYKTRASSSYLSYLLNITSYLSLISLSNDLDYRKFYSNKEVFFNYFNNLSKYNSFNFSKNSLNAMDLNSIENFYTFNTTPNLNELNSHFFLFFVSFLKNKFSFNNSLVKNENKLSTISISSPKSLYSFINAQSYTVHNTKLEII